MSNMTYMNGGGSLGVKQGARTSSHGGGRLCTPSPHSHSKAEAILLCSAWGGADGMPPLCANLSPLGQIAIARLRCLVPWKRLY